MCTWLQGQQPDAMASVHDRQTKSQDQTSGARCRRWAAPDLPLDVEEAHAAAIEAGKPTYTDPSTGYMVSPCASCSIPFACVG